MKSRAVQPPDGGWGWMCVLGKTYCYFLSFGSASAFGIIYIDLIDYFDTKREVAAWIGSLSFGLSLLIGPLSSLMVSKFGIQKTTAAGTLIAFSGCFASWFANGIPYLYVSYGVMMGIGLGLLVVPCNMIVVQYFKTRIGIASTLGSAGNGLATLVLPPLYMYLLEEYGWRGTFLLLSGFVLNGLVCAVIFIPPPYMQAVTTVPASGSIKSTFSCCSSWRPYMILYTLGTGLAFFGYIIPFVHIPDLAVLNGIDKTRATLLVSIMGIASIAGRIVFGWISDFQCTDVTCLQGSCSVLCGVVTLIFPHLTDFYTLAIFSAVYGTFIGVFVSLIPVVLVVLFGRDDTAAGLGMILLLAGIFETVASPIAGWLYDITEDYSASFYVAACPFILSGVIYGAVIVLFRREVKLKVPKNEIHIHTVSESNMDEHQGNKSKSVKQVIECRL